MAPDHRTPPPSEGHPWRTRGRRLAVALGVVAGLGVAWTFAPGVDAMLVAVERVREAGPAGVVLFAGLYLVSTLLMVPGSWIQGAAGFLYGAAFGIPLASVLSTASGTVSFLLARTWLRSTLERKLAHDVRFRAIDGAIGDGGGQLVALLRVSPLSPYNVMNYLLGLTRVRLRDYVVGTWLGSLLPVVLYTYLGSTVGSMAELLDGSASPQSWTLQAVGLTLTLIATVAVTRLARRALREAMPTEA